MALQRQRQVVGGMPQPSSHDPEVSPLPRPTSHLDRLLPASMEFSTSSLTDAGGSTTSPAAMRSYGLGQAEDGGHGLVMARGRRRREPVPGSGVRPGATCLRAKHFGLDARIAGAYGAACGCFIGTHAAYDRIDAETI